jgi:hypothetical protein
MSHDTNTSVLSYSYLFVLLLIAYVMASAPRYVRTFKEHHNNLKLEKVSPLRQVIRFTKYYSVDPYLKAWKSLQPKQEGLASR